MLLLTKQHCICHTHIKLRSKESEKQEKVSFQPASVIWVFTHLLPRQLVTFQHTLFGPFIISNLETALFYIYSNYLDAK